MRTNTVKKQYKILKNKTLILGFCAFPMVFFLLLSTVCAIGVHDTKHNLSVSGTGTVKSAQEPRICIFCHTPHHANVAGDYMPLWSRPLSSANYTLYSSSTIEAVPGQPTGGSRLCLSCHDGTIALGMHTADYNDSSLGFMPIGDTNLTTNLANDHPISFVYDDTLASTAELAVPATLPEAVRLENGRLECTSCHDPHLELFGMFLSMDNTDSGLCETCHIPAGWASSTHGRNDIPGIDVKCEDCHTAHNAGHPENLLQASIPDAEDSCVLNCHNGVGDGIDVASTFGRYSSHPTNLANGVHDPTENPLSSAVHVECADCHNGHKLNSDPATGAPFVSGQLAGVSGVDSGGSFVTTAQREYEICFKCHSSTPYMALTAIDRQIDEPDQRLRFNSLNPSYHPVTAARNNPDVLSLNGNYTTGSMIYCSDCHNTNDGSRAVDGSLKANGAHGSDYQSLLIAEYKQGFVKADIDPYVKSYYDLCWQCHEETVLLAATSFHELHVVTNEVPCSACHDPHGVPGTQEENAFLINFDTSIVTAGTHSSSFNSCTNISCHVDLSEKNYW